MLLAALSALTILRLLSLSNLGRMSNRVEVTEGIPLSCRNPKGCDNRRMSYPPERPTDSVETKDYRGYTIEMRFYSHPDTSLVPMHVYVTKGNTRDIVPPSQEMPIREFVTKAEARRVGIGAAQREIDAMLAK